MNSYPAEVKRRKGKIMKKYLSIILAVLVLAVALVSCFDGGQTTTQPTATQPTTTTPTMSTTPTTGDNQQNDPPEDSVQGSEGLEFTLNYDKQSYSVTGIGTCTDADVIIPDTYEDLPVTSIGRYAFSSWSSLTSVVIPDSVTSIGNSAFICCYSLISIEVDENNEYYKSIDGNLYTKDEKTLIQYAIGKTDISFTIPDSVTKIGGWAFSDCDSLKSVVIGDSVTRIYVGAFSGCSSLTNVVIPSSVTSIDDYAFQDCESLTSVTIPNSVTSIGEMAFAYCDLIASLTIPDSVTSIGRNAFWGWSSLTRVAIPDSVTSIGSGVFGNCTSLTSIEVDEDNENYKSVEGNLYSKDGALLLPYALGKQDELFSIPDSVTSIGDEAFVYCDSLISVIISDSVTSIGYSAFSGCSSLSSVTIGNSVTSICEYAFDGCALLTSVTIGKLVNSIGDNAFVGCDSLTSVVIPDSVTNIGYGAFHNCPLLTSISFEGTVEQWNDIEKGEYWNYNVPATEVVCSNGVVSLK